MFLRKSLQGILQVADDAFLALENRGETAQTSVGEENSIVMNRQRPDESEMEGDHTQKIVS